MKISDLTVEVRNSSFARVGQILASDLIGLQLALRYNKTGSWKLKLRSDHPMVDSLRSPGGGLIVTGPNGVILSGPTVSATNTKTAEDPTGEWEIIGTDDSVVLGERVAYPTPSSADLSAQVNAYDTRTGAAETVAKAYIDANIGPSAPSSRRITGLTIDTDLGRGNTVTGNARFETLGSLCESLLNASQLGFDLVQNGSSLQFKVYAPVDRSGAIRMDVDNLRLEKSEYSYTAPGATRVIVAGSGEGAGRILIERSSTDSTTAETSWGRRIEVFADSRGTADTTALAQAGDDVLVDKGKTIEAVSVTPSDDQTMAYGTDWGLGDKVTVVVNSSEITKIVTEVAIVVTDNGIKVGATVGDPKTASASDTEATVVNVQSSQEARISNLERNEGGIAETVQQYVKNSTGSALTKGQAVYISGASGSNITVGLAKADAEATSSKTLGLLKQDLANGEHGYVVVEGTLDGLNTSGRTAGEAMWLSPTTAGGIVYGLANKPSAPSHMVYLGVVKRVQSNNGSVYVHPQNGFELEELHNVAIVSPANNDLVVYESATSLWKNKPISTYGLASATHTHAAGDITSGSLAVARGGSGGTLGSAWVPVIPTSGNWNSITATGLMYFDNRSFDINGCFTSEFDQYQLIVRPIATATAGYLYTRFKAGGGINSANAYYNGSVYTQGATVSSWQNGAANSYAQIGYVYNDGASYAVLDVHGAYGSFRTTYNFQTAYGVGSRTDVTGNVLFNGTDSFDGIHIAIVGAENMYGYLQVLGLRK